MDAEELRLRAAVCRDPGDDTVRLAYADWLDENAPADTCWQCRGTGGKEWFNDTHGAVDGPCGVCDGTGRHSKGRDYAAYIRLAVKVAEIRRDCWCGGCVKRRGGGPGQHRGRCDVDKPDDEGAQHHYRQKLPRLMENDNATAWFAVPGLGVQLDFTLDRLNWWVQPSGGVIMAVVERGFVRKVTCTAANWFKFADALAWHPTQTAYCPTCLNRTHERNKNMRLYGGFLCVGCGTHHPPGEVPRPFPATAQPITEVELYGIPEYTFLPCGNGRLAGRHEKHWIPRGETYDHSRMGISKMLCEKEWAGIKFRINYERD